MSYCKSNILKASSVDMINDVMNITIIPTGQFVDYKIYILDLCLDLPAHAGTERVIITIDNDRYPMLNRAGNNLHCGQLRDYHCYKIIFGSDPPHFLVFNGLAPMSLSFSELLTLENIRNM